MAERTAKRTTRDLTEAEHERQRSQRAQIADEMPELTHRDRLRHAVAQEPTLSGALRRAVHASGISVPQLADRVGVGPERLDGFLTGEATLPSDVMDRLAALQGCSLTAAR